MSELLTLNEFKVKINDGSIVQAGSAETNRKSSVFKESPDQPYFISFKCLDPVGPVFWVQCSQCKKYMQSYIKSLNKGASTGALGDHLQKCSLAQATKPPEPSTLNSWIKRVELERLPFLERASIEKKLVELLSKTSLTMNTVCSTEFKEFVQLIADTAGNRRRTFDCKEIIGGPKRVRNLIDTEISKKLDFNKKLFLENKFLYPLSMTVDHWKSKTSGGCHFTAVNVFAIKKGEEGSISTFPLAVSRYSGISKESYFIRDDIEKILSDRTGLSAQFLSDKIQWTCDNSQSLRKALLKGPVRIKNEVAVQLQIPQSILGGFDKVYSCLSHTLNLPLKACFKALCGSIDGVSLFYILISF
jgi:hypothetical protein